MKRLNISLEERRAKRLAACKAWGEKHHDRQLQIHAARRARERDEALAVYGRSCYCCGESQPTFLSLDHIDGKGTEHRRAMGSRMSAVTWAKRHGWPPIFRTACHNCNQGAFLNGGTCPHQREANARAERLLLSCLSTEQERTYKQGRYFYVDVGDRRYRVERRAGANVKLLDARGRIAGEYCARPTDVPVEGAMLAQKLWLETNEEAFKKVANFRAHA